MREGGAIFRVVETVQYRADSEPSTFYYGSYMTYGAAKGKRSVLQRENRIRQWNWRTGTLGEFPRATYRIETTETDWQEVPE